MPLQSNIRNRPRPGAPGGQSTGLLATIAKRHQDEKVRPRKAPSPRPVDRRPPPAGATISGDKIRARNPFLVALSQRGLNTDTDPATLRKRAQELKAQRPG